MDMNLTSPFRLTHSSSKGPQKPSTNESTLTVDEYMDSDNTMVEYTSNDMFGDLLQVIYHRY
jgi:hypothetical protein